MAHPAGRCRLARRTVAVSGAVLAAMALPPAPVQAIQSVQRAAATVTPRVAGTPSRPRAVTLSVRAYFDDISADLDQSVQFATVNGKIFLPKEGITNNRLFPSCEPATVLLNERACPPGSRIATGTARGIGLGLEEDLTMQGFNLPAGRGEVILVVGENPLIIREVVVATLTTLTSDPSFGFELSFTMPQTLQSPTPGVLAAVKDFRLTVPAQYLKRHGRDVLRRGRRIPYMATTGCASGRWLGRYVADYTTSFDSAIESTQSVDVAVPCRKP